MAFHKCVEMSWNFRRELVTDTDLWDLKVWSEDPMFDKVTNGRKVRAIHFTQCPRLDSDGISFTHHCSTLSTPMNFFAALPDSLAPVFVTLRRSTWVKQARKSWPIADRFWMANSIFKTKFRMENSSFQTWVLFCRHVSRKPVVKTCI